MLAKGIAAPFTGVPELRESGLGLGGLMVNHITAKVVCLQDVPTPASALGLDCLLSMSPTLSGDKDSEQGVIDSD